MAEQQLIDYIHTSQQNGMSWDAIKQGLLSAGWSRGKVDEAFQAVNIPKPSIPIPPTIKSSGFKKQYTSPYGVLLAVVLVVSLLILAQNAVSDILDRFAPIQSNRYLPNPNALRSLNGSPAPYGNYGVLGAQQNNRIVSPSFRLILHAVVVLPFWIATFLLFVSLKEERKKYEALLGAYYVTSGWLLIFLFFSVAKYIWTSNTVMGVYIVFGMLIVILTGAVWVVQKYRHGLEN